MIAELTAPTQFSAIDDGTATPTSAANSIDLPVATVRWVDEAGADVLEPAQHAPRAGLRVSLRTRTGGECAQTTTDQNGAYHFDDVPAGDYVVIFTLPSVKNPGTATEHSALPAVQSWTRRGSGFRLVGTVG
jgi:SdrD B-like domain